MLDHCWQLAPTSRAEQLVVGMQLQPSNARQLMGGRRLDPKHGVRALRGRRCGESVRDNCVINWRRCVAQIIGIYAEFVSYEKYK